MWQATINNPAIRFEDVKQIILDKWKGVIYFCYSKEIGLENKTPHYHIYLCFKNAVYGSSILKTFEGSHIEVARGTAEENRDYIFKTEVYFEKHPDKVSKEDTRIDGMQFEWGELPKEEKGKRTDLETLKNLILEGKTNAEIYNINANYLRYANSIDKMRLDLFADKFNKGYRNVEVIYVCGPTGAGKTRSVMETYGYGNVYQIDEDDYPFTTYTAEDVVVFEEFRNSFTLKKMLRLLDGHPVKGRAMQGFRQLGYTKVFINSNWELKEQYKELQEKNPRDWQAFLRRINQLKIYTDDGEIQIYKQTFLNGKYNFITEDGQLYFSSNNEEAKQEEPKEENKDVDLLDFMNPDEDYSWTI